MSESADVKDQLQLALPQSTGMTQAEETKLLGPVSQYSSTQSNLNETTTKSGGYPKAVFFIVGNEFCERFSYYGMRAILLIYLTTWLRFTDSAATAIYHTFVVLCYFAPVLGAIIADGYIGKYRTILYLSIVYVFGNAIMTFTAFPPPFWVGPMFGLLLISIGTGGIKPCVSAFGGDQFTSDQTTECAQFFSVFYFVINIGSFLSMLITPLVRENVTCYGTSCYPVAFAIPAILMVVSLVLFLVGSGFYKKRPPTGSVITNFFACIAHALRRKVSHDEPKKEHWLDHADDKYDASFISDVKCVLRVFVLFIPLPVFWALFDQQGSRWTLQAIELDRSITDDLFVPADQIQALNPILVLLLIPFFDLVIYPLLDYCRVPNRPLQRMVAGMSFAAVAFLVTACLQIAIERSLVSTRLSSNQASLLFINSSPCHVQYTSEIRNGSVEPFSQLGAVTTADGFYSVSVQITSCPVPYSFSSSSESVTLDGGQAYFFVTARLENGQIESHLFVNPVPKEVLEGALVGVIGISEEFNDNSTLIRLQGINHPQLKTFDDIKEFKPPNFVEVSPGRYCTSVVREEGTALLATPTNSFVAKNRGVYTLVVQPSTANVANQSQWLVSSFVNVEPNSVTVWLQLPQYFIMTVGEILFAISGLHFAYSQAPPTMKSVVTAGWLLTTAFGNLITVIVASVRIPSQTAEFFFFFILMTVTTVIFAIMASFYTYVNHSLDEPTTTATSNNEQTTTQ